MFCKNHQHCWWSYPLAIGGAFVLLIGVLQGIDYARAPADDKPSIKAPAEDKLSTPNVESLEILETKTTTKNGISRVTFTLKNTTQKPISLTSVELIVLGFERIPGALFYTASGGYDFLITDFDEVGSVMTKKVDLLIPAASENSIDVYLRGDHTPHNIKWSIQPRFSTSGWSKLGKAFSLTLPIP